MEALVLNQSGLVIYTDADFAGLYAATGEVRSRTGIYASYNGMPTSWKSCWQNLQGAAVVAHAKAPDMVVELYV